MHIHVDHMMSPTVLAMKEVSLEYARTILQGYQKQHSAKLSTVILNGIINYMYMYVGYPFILPSML